MLVVKVNSTNADYIQHVHTDAENFSCLPLPYFTSTMKLHAILVLHSLDSH